jgi:subtilase family serine protease
MRTHPAIVTAVAAAALSAGLPGVPAAAAARSAAAAVIGIAPGVRLIASGAKSARPYTDAECVADFGVRCLTPRQLNAAYDEGPLFSRGITGSGQTIVIVDPFGSPAIRHDLGVFDKAFGYPAPPSLKVIRPAGPVTFDPASVTDLSWAAETSLDVEYAHAIAPGASILLAQTPVAESEGVTGFPQIIEAENYVINHHLGDIISQSFQATEQTFAGYAQIAPLRSAYVNAARHGVTVLAAAGDSGVANSDAAGTAYYTYPTTGWPASDPLVTGVGGTEVKPEGNGRYTSVVWNDSYDASVVGSTPSPAASGGGLSHVFRRPWYQDRVRSIVGRSRGVPDISMSASCSEAVQVYASFPGMPAGWSPACGTSEATPEFAGIVALAGQVAHRRLGLLNPLLYALSARKAPGIVDVTSGDTTVSFLQDGRKYTIRGYPARPGYDLASGVGTVDAAYLAYELAGKPPARPPARR